MQHLPGFVRENTDRPTGTAHWEPNQGSEPAGLDIHGKPVEVDVGSDYESYKTFEIEFENSPSMLMFFLSQMGMLC